MTAAVLAALCLDMLLGDPYWFYHPVRLFGHMIAGYESVIRRIRQTPLFLKIAGGILAIGLPIFVYTITAGMIVFATRQHPILGFILQVILMWTCIALQCLKKEVLKIYQAFCQGDTEEARKLVSFLVSRDTKAMSEQDIIRATIETAAENTSDGIIAPLFYLLIGGAPLGMAYKAINTMDSMVGYCNEAYQDFGFFPAKLDDAANFLPARLTGFLMLAWAFITRKNYQQGMKILWRDHKNSKSPNAGWPEAALAGILQIALGGNTSYFGKVVKKPIIGDAERALEKEDIKAACAFFVGPAILLFGIAALIRWWIK